MKRRIIPIANEHFTNSTRFFRMRRRASAVVLALVLGTVLMLVIAGVSSFASFRVTASTQEWNNIKALGIAEAGLSLALTELSVNSAFATHKVNADSDLTWTNTEENNKQSVADNVASFSLKITNKTKGTYEGTFGDGQFKVRCAAIPLTDDPNTMNIDESKCYLKIESMGCYKDTIKIVRAVVQRRFPGREFLLYDGGFLSIVFGLQNENKTNIFSDGHLYGLKGVEIGQVCWKKHTGNLPGTKQEFKNLELLSSGLGNIYVYSKTKMSFRGEATPYDFERNCNFPQTGGTYNSGGTVDNGGMPEQLEKMDPPPEIKGLATKFVKDKNHGAAVIELTVNWKEYSTDANSGGKYYAAGDTPYALPTGWPGGSEQVKVLDFGNDITPATPDIPGNGVIFCEDSIVVKGNPTKPLTIISKKNIFIQGDFNQRGLPGRVGQLHDAERYGFAQNYDNNPQDADDYTAATAKFLKEDAPPAAEANRHHQPVTLIANQRIVFDYRNPISCFENELYPFVKFALAKKLASKSSDLMADTLATPKILALTGSGEIESEAGAKTEIASLVKDFFTNTYKVPSLSSTDLDTLATNISNKYNSGAKKFSETDTEAITKDVWKVFRDKYETDKDKPDFGVYTLLNELRMKCKNTNGGKDKHDDYLFFPEMTNNGMFISCGEINTQFYMGPDQAKLYDEIGNKDQTGIGREHSSGSANNFFVHRMYGSECKLRTNKSNPKVTGGYHPSIRKKLYDPILPRFWSGSGQKDLAAFVVISWEDYRVSPAEFTNF